MASIRKLKSGRWQVSYENARSGFGRTRRNFATRKQAAQYARAIEDDAQRILCGQRTRRLFGEALTRYLNEDSRDKLTHADDISNARALRVPAWDASAKSWRRIEQAPLNPSPGELSVPAALEIWTRDQQQIIRRSRMGGRHYQLRPAPGGPVWFFQPTTGALPEPRREVTDPAMIRRLDSSASAGPFSQSTLRIRQSLVARVLKLAWQSWDWCDSDQSGRVQYRQPALARESIITRDELLALVCAAEPPFADLILGAAWTGLRRSNLLALSWDRVVFTARDGDGSMLQRGYFWVPARGDTPGERSKNGETLWQPMSERVEQLFAERWRSSCGRLVFHQGDGRPWGDFRRRWAAAKLAAGVAPSVRWHDLRATWATGYAGQLTTAQLQALGGWKDSSSAERYIRLQRAHLEGLAERYER
jgi:integrase